MNAQLNNLFQVKSVGRRQRFIVSRPLNFLNNMDSIRFLKENRDLKKAISVFDEENDKSRLNNSVPIEVQLKRLNSLTSKLIEWQAESGSSSITVKKIRVVRLEKVKFTSQPLEFEQLKRKAINSLSPLIKKFSLYATTKKSSELCIETDGDTLVQQLDEIKNENLLLQAKLNDLINDLKSTTKRSKILRFSLFFTILKLLYL